MGTGTEIGRVRGLGSARHGAQHWLGQRLSAAGNLVLVLWFLFSLASLPSLEHGVVVAWLASPFAAVPALLMIANVFVHIRAGMQVLIEDYVHDEGAKLAAIILLNAYVILTGALGMFAIAKIAFAGATA